MGRDERGTLPALGALLESAETLVAITTYGRRRVADALRSSIESARTGIAAGEKGVPADAAVLIQRALTHLRTTDQQALRPVINATGVLLHTNLGRAPLGAPAIEAMLGATGPTNLELDLTTGQRGGRERFARDALLRLTGGEAALLVNNCAAALTLALHALAAGEPVIISRGELVEIGGSFRIPEIIAASGARLLEVGTTNRTHLEDYRQGLRAGGRAILRVHPSNYRIEGFTAAPTDAALAELAEAAGVPFIHDVGSGLLDAVASTLTARLTGMLGEPNVNEAVRHADLVVFSGDKLLGGPQVGILIGRDDLISRCARAPLARALRLDKLRLAALEGTLRSLERDAQQDIPLLVMAGAEVETLRGRAETIADRAGGRAVPLDAVLGGGSTPGTTLPSFGIAVEQDAEEIGRRLRAGDPAVVGRIEDGRLLLDLRTVPPESDETLIVALLRATGDRS